KSFTNTNTSQATIPNPNPKSKTHSNQKIPTLQEFLKDSKLEKIDNWHIYCHYCNTGQSIILYRIDNNYKNVECEQANPSKKHHTTFLHFEKKQRTLNTEKYSESSKKGVYVVYPIPG
ncbi:29177_t:CDS:2, partial [Gigaspora margarita]